VTVPLSVIRGGPTGVASDVRMAVLDRMLEAMPPPPAGTGGGVDLDADALLDAFDEMCRRYDEVVASLPASISMAKPRSPELEAKMAELAARQKAWATALSEARATVAARLAGAGKLHRYTP
jgi:hypothetical protein